MTKYSVVNASGLLDDLEPASEITRLRTALSNALESQLDLAALNTRLIDELKTVTDELEIQIACRFGIDIEQAGQNAFVACARALLDPKL